MLPHFKDRWGIDRDLYRLAIEQNIRYLQHLIENHPHDYRTLLKRGGLIAKLEMIEGAENGGGMTEDRGQRTGNGRKKVEAGRLNSSLM